jgi:hypothetical protein
MWISVLRRLHPKRRSIGRCGGWRRRGSPPPAFRAWYLLAAMIMRRVGRVNSCHRPLPGYALALTMSVRPPGCRRECGWAGGPGAKPADLPVGTGLGLVISRRFCQMMGVTLRLRASRSWFDVYHPSAADCGRWEGRPIGTLFAAVHLVRNWHETDVLCAPTNVCSWWKSGHAAEEEISDVSLRTFYVFDKEDAGTPRLRELLARPKGSSHCGRCGRGCVGPCSCKKGCG